MTPSLKRDVTRNGYALIRDCSPESDTVGIACMLGEPLIPWEGGLVQRLIPRVISTPNTYSGIYGLGRFPFHTDLASRRDPPRYLLLRCVTGYADVPTLLVDGQILVEAVTPDILARAIFKPRRPRDGEIPLLRLYEPIEEGQRFRWDETFLKPASKIGSLADLRVREWLAHCDPLSIALARAGDMLVIDNWRMLHARSPISSGREDRQIERVYLGAIH